MDEAVQRLTEPGTSKAARELAQANLPLALLRRALARVETGDAGAAQKDVELAEQVPAAQAAGPGQAGRLHPRAGGHGGRRFGDASACAQARRSPRRPRWAAANTRALMDAYMLYRKEQVPQARKALAQPAQEAPRPGRPSGSPRSPARSTGCEGERAYATGNLQAGGEGLQGRARRRSGQPSSSTTWPAWTYRKGKAARTPWPTWRKLEASVPRATLNLGIDAQERRKDIPEAVESYRRYLASGGGPRMAAVPRVEGSPAGHLRPASGAPAPTSNSDEATATETTP